MDGGIEETSGTDECFSLCFIYGVDLLRIFSFMFYNGAAGRSTFFKPIAVVGLKGR